MQVPPFVAWMFPVGMMVLGAGFACGQDYPNKPIRFVTAAPGGGIDFTARMVAQGLTGSLNEQVVVDNRGGTSIAEQTVAKAPPDGYTILVHNNTVWTLPLLQKAPYDPTKDLLPITLATRSPNMLVVHPSMPVNSVKELIALAKASPGAINYAAGAIGASNHLAAELFKAMAGVNLARIGYKGGGPALNDLISGQVQVMFATTGSVTPHVKSGRLRALAVTSAEPSALAPGLPTIAASGVPGYESVTLYGLFAPAKTPATIINRLNRETVLFLNMPDTKERFFNSGVETVGSSSQEFATAIRTDIARLVKVIKDAGLRVE